MTRLKSYLVNNLLGLLITFLDFALYFACFFRIFTPEIGIIYVCKGGN